MCPTQWTVRAKALTSIAENYQALQLTWDAAKEATKDTEMGARIGGVAAQMEKFDLFFGVELGQKVLNMADNLSRSLQAATLSACEGQQVAKTTLATFQAIRTDECFIFSGNTLRPEGLQLMCHLPPFHGVGRFHDDLKLGNVFLNIPLQPKIITGRFISK